MQENKERAFQFRKSLQRWGEIFMLINWLNSIMISAVAAAAAGGKTSSASGKTPEAYRQCRNGLMSRSVMDVWRIFTGEFGKGSEQEENEISMISLIRHQLAHPWISSGHEFALFRPAHTGTRLLDKLDNRGWIMRTEQDISDPPMLIVREQDEEWYDKNRELIFNFMEDRILKRTRERGIRDEQIC